jgi:hypothetical protein
MKVYENLGDSKAAAAQRALFKSYSADERSRNRAAQDLLTFNKSAAIPQPLGDESRDSFDGTGSVKLLKECS